MKTTEENFIFYLKNKNERALEYVINNYGWIVKSIVKKHLYNLTEHQEACINDVFLGVWDNIHCFDPNKGTFKNWVAGIAKYKTIDCRRKYLKQMQNENFEIPEIATEDDYYNCGPLRLELDRDLDELLSCLKSQDKELFLKLYVEEQDVNSVSKETGLKRDVIYNRIFRGKQKLRKKAHILERRV